MSWFSPNTVSRNYYQEHIVFVLRNLSDILLGLWPPRDKPDGTSDRGYYVASPGELPTVNKKGYYSAPWENVISIGVEVERRIDMTGRDGDFARTIYTQGIDYLKLAEMESKRWWYLTNTERLDKAIEIQNRVERAIEYSSGKKRKIKPYREVNDGS